MNLLKDMSTITTINERDLSKLLDVAVGCINETIYEDLVVSKKDISEVDIGLGTLNVQVLDNRLLFKFIPCAKLSDAILSTVKNETNDLVTTLEKSVVERITHTYKDII